jgi:hypothetical protein
MRRRGAGSPVLWMERRRRRHSDRLVRFRLGRKLRGRKQKRLRPDLI